jgi:hypothetical protein
MRKTILYAICTICLLSCGPERGQRTYYLENAPFPHPEREQGFERNAVFYPEKAHYSDNTVAVYIPQAYRKSGKLNLLIHFHGWGNQADRCINQFDLAGQVEASGRDVILVVPQGPRNAPDSFFGKLCDEGGFGLFIGELLDSLKNDRLIRNKNIGDIIPSGHSGAYYVIAHILRYGDYAANIRDVLLFDGLYALEEDYLNWLSHDRGRFVHIYTRDGGTMDNSLDFMKRCDSLGLPYVHANTADLADMPAGRILILYSDLAHNAVIAQRQNLLKLLR